MADNDMPDSAVEAIPYDAVLARRSNLIEAEVDDDLLGLNVDSGMCYGMNATASAIWRKLETPLSFESLVEWLVSGFDVPRDQCVRETTLALRVLADDGLLVIRAHGAP